MRAFYFIFAGLALGGCADRPENHYPLSVADAFARLNAADTSVFRFARQCGILIHIQAEGTPDRSVTWRVSSRGQEQLNFTANLTAISPKETKVDIAVSEALDGGEAYDGTKFYPHPAVRQPTRGAIAEHVAATLEGRAFDVERLQPIEQDSVCDVQRAGLESGYEPFNAPDASWR